MIKVQKSASLRIDDIYQFSLKSWGEEQARKYINGLFVAFNNIENNQVASKPIPAEFEVIGFYFKYEKHFVYWKYLDNGDIGIVTILHEKMHQIKHFSQLSWKK